MYNTNQTLEILVAIHSFCATITKEEFLTSIGRETTWNKLTEGDTRHPDIYNLLSYADDQTRRNLIDWLHNRIHFLKEQRFLGGVTDQ